MSKVSIFNIVLETKAKIERHKVLFPGNIPKIKRNFLDVTGMDEDKWEIIYNSPPIKEQQDLNNLLNALF